MSTVNVSTIYTEYVNAIGNVFVGNTISNVALRSNNSITVGSNVFMNSSYISVSNSSGNTQINSTSISTTGITVGGVFVNSSDNQVSNYQSFTANGTWTKPSWAQANDLVTIMLWGGGGGGAYDTNPTTPSGTGGGGGAFVYGYILASNCNATCNVVVGLGGTGGIAANGGDGGTSIFYFGNVTENLSAYGGGGGCSLPNGYGGGGGGWFSAGNTSSGGGGPLGNTGGALGNNVAGASTFGGGGGGAWHHTQAGNSVYGGGGGGDTTNSGVPRYAGTSIYGGGGGGSNSALFFGFGGSGGYIYPTRTSPQAPGGGGVGEYFTSTVSAGARGEVRVWVQKVT